MSKIKNYTAATEELETILNALKSDAVSIDKLAEKIKRAKELLAYCQEVLRKTEAIILE